MKSKIQVKPHKGIDIWFNPNTSTFSCNYNGMFLKDYVSRSSLCKNIDDHIKSYNNVSNFMRFVEFIEYSGKKIIKEDTEWIDKEETYRTVLRMCNKFIIESDTSLKISFIGKNKYECYSMQHIFRGLFIVNHENERIKLNNLNFVIQQKQKELNALQKEIASPTLGLFQEFILSNSESLSKS